MKTEKNSLPETPEASSNAAATDPEMIPISAEALSEIRVNICHALEAAIDFACNEDVRIPLEDIEAYALQIGSGLILGRDLTATVSSTGTLQGDTLTVRLQAREEAIFFDVGNVAASATAKYQ